MNAHSARHLLFDSPATYQIRVCGQIPASRADWLGDMSICLVMSESEPAITVLEGELSDQAALAGVLNTLYEWHLPVLSVERFTAPCRGSSSDAISSAGETH